MTRNWLDAVNKPILAGFKNIPKYIDKLWIANLKECETRKSCSFLFYGKYENWDFLFHL